MSLVTLQIGQCGNQIGGELFSTLISDIDSQARHLPVSQEKSYKEASLERFFNTTDTRTENEILQARSVMVDMESKVISKSLIDAKRTGKWTYPDKQQFCQKRGSGNNWAHGYCVHGPKSKEKILEMVQREVEKCDNFNGFVTFMSLAGGTGSGVGAYMTECLREEFPHSFILNQVVWPYNTGEVIVQNYNALLTLSHLYQCSDAVLTMENDSLHKICTQLMGIKKVSFKDINSVITHKIASIIQPAFDDVKPTTWKSPIRNHLGSLLEHLVSHPDYKLLTVQNIPQMSKTSIEYSTFQWKGLLKHMRQMLIANADMEEGINWSVKTGSHSSFNKSIANLLVLRGKDIEGVDLSPFSESRLYPSWMPSCGTFQAWAHPRSFNHYEKSATLVSNSQAPIAALDKIISKGWNMFASRAYVHQYTKHGLGEEDFMDTFACLEQVIANYKQLS